MVWAGLLLALQLTNQASAQSTGLQVSVLVARARAARLQQDSTLASYQAVVRQRWSAGIGVARGLVGTIARERLAARMESVARVGWHHETGAWAELLGARGVAPIAGEMEVESVDDVALSLPYYPGRDRLWPFSELVEALPKHDEWIDHPLDAGADSLYAFALGDSLGIRLPDGGLVRVREIRIRPRRPASRLVVGSLWVDVASGSLVRAAYRPSVPMDLWPFMEREIGSNDRDAVRKFGPFTGVIREILVEHGLYEGRFWLPRTRIANAEGTAKGGRISMSIEQTFRYERVAALAAGERSKFVEPAPDVDPVTGRIRHRRWYGVQERTRRCRHRRDSTAARWTPDSLAQDEDLTIMYAEGVRFRVLVPCDENDLVHSKELPESIYDPSDELFRDTDLKALQRDVEGALALSKQAEWEPQPPTVHFGIDRGLLRYNRVEGLSAGVAAERVMGSGYTAGGLVRLGSADLEPNAEAFFARSNVKSSIEGRAFRRLAAVNDWGNPLGLGASAVALLFGRDDGFYYRTGGAEINGSYRPSAHGSLLSWRVFGERHDVARAETDHSLAHVINDTRFQPNIFARSGEYYGGAGAASYAWGDNPTGTRLAGALRAEGAGGTSTYGRFMTEHTVSQGLGNRVQGTLTAAAGTSAGNLPPQRMWYLGDAYTVRGHRAGDAVGDAFWLARAELARGHPVVRPTVFGDVGWAGSRSDWSRQGQPLVAVGAGASAIDGLVRLDVSRGLGVTGRWRADLYLEVR
jgi:hypothetical protein